MPAKRTPLTRIPIGSLVRDLRTNRAGTFHGWTVNRGCVRAAMLIRDRDGCTWRYPRPDQVVIFKRRLPEGRGAA